MFPRHGVGWSQRYPKTFRLDHALAGFFLVLSEFNGCSAEACTFATKCSEYCQSEASDGWSESLVELKDGYRLLSSSWFGPDGH